MDPLKMYFLLKMEIFHRYLSLPEGMLILEGGTCYDPSIRLFRRPKHLDLSWDSFFAKQVGCILRIRHVFCFWKKRPISLLDSWELTYPIKNHVWSFNVLFRFGGIVVISWDCIYLHVHVPWKANSDLGKWYMYVKYCPRHSIYIYIFLCFSCSTYMLLFLW